MDPIGKFNNIFYFSWIISTSVLIDKMFSFLVILYQQNNTNNKCEHEPSSGTLIVKRLESDLKVAS